MRPKILHPISLSRRSGMLLPNGKAEIDNNTAERMMKPICLGRNNYLFCGAEPGAKNTSLLYSIIETCKMNGLRPVKYIADVLRKLVAGATNTPHFYLSI